MNGDSSKLGTELNLALNTDENELNKSFDLSIGYEEEFDEWELIIRYIGSLEEISNIIGFTYTELFNGYGIINIKKEKIDELSNNSNIIFIEKPKGLYFEQSLNTDNANLSCMNNVSMVPYNLTGKGILVAVIDSGIDYRHPIFIEENGNGDKKSKIFGIWDQTVDGNPPEGYRFGTFYDREDINQMINNADNSRLITSDYSGHGTGVSSVIASLVNDADLLIIKLKNIDNVSKNQYTKTTSLMYAIDFAINMSTKLAIPLVINISLGNNYGDHSSNSILENYIDSVANVTKSAIVIGTGNDGGSGRHFNTLISSGETREIEFVVGEFETAINLQIWYSYSDVANISMIDPTGKVIGPFSKYQEVMNYSINNMDIGVINGYPTPINQNQETYISIIPKGNYIEAGIWKIIINGKSISDGRFDIWLPVSGSTSSDVFFLNPSEETTLTIPSTAIRPISVGAYNSKTLSYANFSGRGYTANGVVKPEISAPGVNIEVATLDGGYGLASGTSFATPFVSAGAAMLMQWGIIDGNDPYLYGEKLKSYLIRGARKLPGYKKWPNPYLGYGALCVYDSLKQ